jgi:hypothetical protein
MAELPSGRAEFPLIAKRSEHAVGGQNLPSIIALCFHAPWALTLVCQSYNQLGGDDDD